MDSCRRHIILLEWAILLIFAGSFSLLACEDEHYAKLADILERADRATQDRSHKVATTQITEKAEALLTQIKEEGGEGYVVTDQSIDSMANLGFVRLIEPPSGNRFGSTFSKTFEHYRLANIPVYVVPKLNNDINGELRNAGNRALVNSKLALLLGPQSNNTLNIHEKQHADDISGEAKPLLKGLPPVPKNLEKALDRLEKGEKITRWERVRLYALGDLLNQVLEKRATGRELQTLVRPSEFGALFNSKFPSELFQLYAAMTGHLLEHRPLIAAQAFLVNPLHPKSWFLSVKGLAAGTLGFALNVGILIGLPYIVWTLLGGK